MGFGGNPKKSCKKLTEINITGDIQESRKHRTEITNDT